MQIYHPDAASKFKSLDDIYYYGGQNEHHVVAVFPHEPRKAADMQMRAGDLIGKNQDLFSTVRCIFFVRLGVAGNHWDGFSKGRNLRTNQIGLYPTFKVKDKIETAKFPTYSQTHVKDNEN